jgi:hypothetical protein
MGDEFGEVEYVSPYGYCVPKLELNIYSCCTMFGEVQNEICLQIFSNISRRF